MIPAGSVASSRDCALVVIDVQERLAAVMSRRGQVIARAVLAIMAARTVGIPIVITRQHPRGLGDVEPEVAEAVAQAQQHGSGAAHFVDKMAFDCFSEPGFCDAIAQTGARQLLLCGMETHICVTQTALSGLREGFDVHVALDACCSRRAESHEIALARLAGAGAVPTSMESAIYELVGCAGTDEFKAVLAAVKACDERLASDSATHA